jgi:hypothetical protein
VAAPGVNTQFGGQFELFELSLPRGRPGRCSRRRERPPVNSWRVQPGACDAAR